MPKKYRKYRKRYRGMSANKKASIALKKIRRIENRMERKYKDYAVSGDDVNTTGNVEFLNDIDQGLDVDDRIGDKIAMKTIMIRGYITTTHGTPSDCVVRFMIVKRTANDGTAPSIGTILATGTDVNSMQNKDWVHEVKVLYDETFAMDTTQHSIVPFKIRLTKLKTVAKYDGTGAGVTDCQTNGYYFVYMSNIAGTTDDPLITYRYRVTFEDN